MARRSVWKVSFRTGLAAAALSSLALTPGGNPVPDFGQPLAGLGSEELERFDEGLDEFSEVETAEEGLGPIFNDVSCATCHLTPAVGGGSEVLETRFGRLGSDGLFDAMPEFGGGLIQKNGIGIAGLCDYLAELVPGEATIVADRRTTPLFGLGLVDATPDSTFKAIALEEKFHPDGIAGKVSMVPNISTGRDAVGKFGWKAQNPSLFQFSGDAYLNEMGVTSPEFPDENCPGGDCDSLSCNPLPGMNDDGSGVEAFADFMTFLAPPPRGPITASALGGELVFKSLGCAGCHRQTIRTGPNAIAALNKVYYQPYSDFLLHDMGALSDGVTQNKATGKMMRTAPLWGLRKITRFLHDGRASTYDQAILAHDGQGKKARDRFAALPAWQKTLLYAFLGSL
jgi:CxxC motif-containing protein (DUF1111 family)